MKIIIQNTNSDISPTEPYYLTPKGLYKSEKNTKSEDLIIGRQYATHNNIRPNDILLPGQDRAVSRIHAKIIYKDGFNIKRKIPDSFIAFLMTGHNRLGAPKKFYIADLGSAFGTYLKLQQQYLFNIQEGQNYLIGADFKFSVLTVNKREKSGLNYELNLQQDFLKYLAYEKHFNNAKLHGISQSTNSIIDYIINTEYNEKEFSSSKTILIEDMNYEVPFLKIQFTYAPQTTPKINIFIPSKEKSEFIIGRAEETDIVIYHTTISRKQCKFTYQEITFDEKQQFYENVSPCKYEWLVSDGIKGNESSNGTWLSLTDSRIQDERKESYYKEIKNRAEVKICDSTLKIQIINND